VKTNDLALAAGHSVDPACWQDAFENLIGRIAGRFARVEPRRRVKDFVLGLLSDLPRKNCWTIAEWAGEASPDGMQHLIGRATWDTDAVRDDLREYVVEHLHDDDAVLVVDETGDVKKGTHTVGVQRQLKRSGSDGGSDVPRVWWSHLAGQMMLQILKEASVPRSYPAEFRRKILDLVEAGRPIRQIAHDLGISEQTIYVWRRQHLIDTGRLPGPTSKDQAELVAARRRIAELAIHRRAAELIGKVVPPKDASRPSR
jgi:transposase-like protein